MSFDECQDAGIQPYDDESCREFLAYELGEEIARFYRYTEGIHEVQKRLILRYGDENFAKAMSVFHELLELEDNASGLGDDGDFWRSWRHDYKQRREDFANPGTPRFPGTILPSPIRGHRRHIAIRSQYQPFGEWPSDTPSTPNQSTPSARSTYPDGSSPQSSQLSTRDFGVQTDPTRIESDGKAQRRRNTLRRKSGSGELHRTMSQKLRGLFSKDKGQGFTGQTDRKENDNPRTPTAARPQERPRLPSFNFDGGGDDHDDTQYSRSSNEASSINLNEAIPPLPLNFQKAIQRQQSRASQSYSSEASAPNRSTSSTANHSMTSSLDLPGASGRDEFRNLTRNLISSDPSESSAGLLGDFSALSPKKYNPPSTRDSSTQLSDPVARYASVLNENPFGGERNTWWPTCNEDPVELPTTSAPHFTPYNTPSKSKGLGHSRSESGIAFLPPSRSYDALHATSTVHFDEVPKSPGRGRKRLSHRHLDMLTENVEDDEFERTPRRTRSPMKKMFGENGWLGSGQSPPARSKSPMKKMFGENGWLGRSESLKGMLEEQQKKTGIKHWGGKIKQRVGGSQTERPPTMIPPNIEIQSKESAGLSRFPVSLDPPLQARLYSELELMICVTANQFLLQQRKYGRMSVDSLVKITEFWRTKGRPQVIEFQFDQATQRDLILYNIKTFHFHGENADNAVAVHSMLYSWKTLAKEMAVRTFCTPDSILRKHLHDMYKILEMLGAPLTTFLAYQDLQLRALNIMKEEQQIRDEKRIESLAGGGSKSNVSKTHLPTTTAKVRSSNDVTVDRRTYAGMFEG